jgi:hypothetical protein
MPEHELGDVLLVAVRQARPAINDEVLSPSSDRARDVLARVLAGDRAPETAPRRTMWWPRIGALAAMAAVAVVVVIALSAVSSTTSLVDRAYAAVNAGDQVVHEVDLITEPSARGYYSRVEGWNQPGLGRARLIQISGTRPSRLAIITEWIITASGQAYGRSCLSGCRPASFINGDSKWTSDGNAAPGGFGGVPQDLPGTFAQEFRTAYRDHAVVSAGTTTFDGEDVARFQSMVAGSGRGFIAWRPGTPIPTSIRGTHPLYALVDWYVDPSTAAPVGFETLGCSNDRGASSCHAVGDVVRIVTLQRLAPTSQNLFLLTGPGAPRGAR